MPTSFKQILVCSLLCFLVSFNFTVGVNNVKSVDTNRVVVLFDEGHGQFFNRSLYSQALADLNELGMEVVFNNEELNRTSFEGIDAFISTNPSSSFSSEEKIHIVDFLEEGKGILLLANPLIEENDSLNGNGYELNQILQNIEGTLARFWLGAREDETHELDDVVKNDKENLGKPEYILLEVNNTDTENEIFTKYENISLIATYSCSIKDGRENLIVGSTETYAETPLRKPHIFSSKVAIFAKGGSLGDINARIIVGGSSIMFSDLEDPLLNNATSWYETADNSVLWKNTISYLAETSQEGILPPPDDSNYPLFFAGTALVTTVILIGGVFLYTIGSGQQIPTVTKEEFVSPKPSKKKVDSTEDQISKKKPSKTKLSKRDRRLQQLKKSSRKK